MLVHERRTTFHSCGTRRIETLPNPPPLTLLSGTTRIWAVWLHNFTHTFKSILLTACVGIPLRKREDIYIQDKRKIWRWRIKRRTTRRPGERKRRQERVQVKHSVPNVKETNQLQLVMSLNLEDTFLLSVTLTSKVPKCTLAYLSLHPQGRVVFTFITDASFYSWQWLLQEITTAQKTEDKWPRKPIPN